MGFQFFSKTSFTINLLEQADSIFKPFKPGFTILIYETWQSSYEIMQEKKLVNLSIKGFDNIDYLKELFEENIDKGGTLLLVDDQMQKKMIIIS